ncbi:thioesterase (plasmid) [Skermanella sp. TT6]|uniref:Thioesterase n=1 Tax=Skermanella cutis TaxID=2775420 RepID=A0ABX7BJ32_9PROT|nr:alpha/beta fold hydrolase [Skermanella sp. TT6]QQP93601.1 thioesterase [Skermanella sp. TT6]
MTGTGRITLFCFAHAGAGASAYRSWVSAAPFRVVPVQYPGREDRIAEEPFSDIGALAAHVERRVLDQVGGGRYALFGHSMGAMVAYELAQRLRGRDVPQPCALFVSGREPPHRPRLLEPVSHLDDRALIDRIVALGGTPAEVAAHPELLELVIPILRADFRACETYRPTLAPPLALPIHVLCGERDDHVVVEELGEWRDHGAGAGSVTLFPGGHFYLSSARDAVIARIAALLRDVAPGG